MSPPATFDKLRFGPSRTLNLRDVLLTPAEAAARLQRWLRAKQAEHAGELLLLVDRGSGSAEFQKALRHAVLRELRLAKRLGVVRDVRESAPGSFSVWAAPLRALLEAPARRRGTPHSDAGAAIMVEARLSRETRDLSRRLALRALESLGVQLASAPLLENEASRQLALLAQGAPTGPSMDAWLRRALARALHEYEDQPS